jgi:tetratricopeptide (TPR) repeat protein
MRPELVRDLALAYAERGHNRADYGDLAAAVDDLARGLRTDPRSAAVCRLAGLTSTELARHYHDRGRPAYERVNWADAIAHLRRAIWLDPKLRYELQGILDEAQRNYTALISRPGGLASPAVTAPALVSLHPG